MKLKLWKWLSDNLDRRVIGLLILVPALVVTLQFLGGVAPLDRKILELKYRWLAEPASGEVTVVEIDAGTIDAIGVWPFPRGKYAELIDRLNASGAHAIAMDVDFSARSSLAGDKALLEAIERSAAPVYLPTFVQQGRRASRTGQLVARAPEFFARSASSFGAVNVVPESDSKIWNYDAFQTIDGQKRPSLALLLAEGRVSADRFLIDYAIDYESMAFVSMADILAGDFDRSKIEGKRILVGATAIELGDQLPVPRYGFLPGVYVQAMAAESLLGGRVLQPSNLLTSWVGLLLLLPIGLLILKRSWQVSALLALGAGISVFALSVGLQAVSSLVLHIGAWLFALSGWWLFDLLRTLQEQALRLFRQRMSGTYRRELMRRVVDDSFDGVVMTDSLGKIERVNRTAEKLLRVRADQVIGKPLADAFPSAVHSQIAQRIEAGRAGERFECALSGADGRAIDVEMTVGVIQVPLSKSPFERRRTERRVYVLTFRDISERKIAEEAKSEALREAFRANRAKSQFLASVSHELRTPLNAILGFSDLMRSQVFGAIGNKRYIEYVESINHSGQLLLELINSILDISRMESGENQLKLEIFETEALLDECMSVMEGLIAKSPRTVTFAVDQGAAYLCADRSLMRQVFINLLTNAFKFTDECGQIRVTATLAEDGCVTIEVMDNGFGIASEEQGHIFEPFRQASGAYVRKSSGSGLGLYIVNRIIVAHGGEIEVESELDHGTTIRIQLPDECTVAAPHPGTEVKVEA